MSASIAATAAITVVSVLFNEPKLLKSVHAGPERAEHDVSVLFNEPKLLKCRWRAPPYAL